MEVRDIAMAGCGMAGATGEANKAPRVAFDCRLKPEFPSYGQALACYRAPAYQPVKALREAASEVVILIVAGYDGPQP